MHLIKYRDLPGVQLTISTCSFSLEFLDIVIK